MIESYNLFTIGSWLVRTDSKVQLPVMQRGFVWKPVQIERVWDSILRGFPVGAFMLSKATDDTKWLFDGQQRSTSIALGLYSPWEDDITTIGNAKQLPVIWLDLNSKQNSYEQKFVVRAVTQSHPWGYRLYDNSSILSVADRRAAAELLPKDTRYIELKPTERRPYDSYLPIPLSFAITPFKDNAELSYEEWRQTVINKVKHYFPDGITTKHTSKEDYLVDLEKEVFSDIYKSIKENALTLEVPGIIVKSEIVSFNDNDNENSDPTLFIRINSEGTRLEGEELIYSIYKSICPETKNLVESLSQNIISPAKTITLVSKLAYADINNGSYINNITVRRFQTLILDPGPDPDSDFSFKTELLKYIGTDVENSQIKVLYDKAIDILSREGLVPAVVIRQLIATKTELFLLLLYWLNRNDARGINDSEKSLICARFYHIAWFGDTELFVRKMWDKVDMHDFWQASVNDGEYIEYPFISPELLQQYFTEKVNSRSSDYTLSADKFPEIWKIWERCIGGEQLATEQLYTHITNSWSSFIQTIRTNRLLVLLAQAPYINKQFPEFNQLNRLEETNTPWDWDHIYPSEWVYRKWSIHPTTREWNNTIGNLRAMSLSVNRSESNKLSPYDRLRESADIRKDYFIDDNSDWQSWQQLKGVIHDHNDEMVTLHAKAIIQRIVNIYKYFIKNIANDNLHL